MMRRAALLVALVAACSPLPPSGSNDPWADGRFGTRDAGAPAVASAAPSATPQPAPTLATATSTMQLVPPLPFTARKRDFIAWCTGRKGTLDVVEGGTEAPEQKLRCKAPGKILGDADAVWIGASWETSSGLLARMVVRLSEVPYDSWSKLRPAAGEMDLVCGQAEAATGAKLTSLEANLKASIVKVDQGEVTTRCGIGSAGTAAADVTWTPLREATGTPEGQTSGGIITR
jgi:hypothetical protein